MLTWSKTLPSGTELFFTGAQGFSEISPCGTTNLAFHVGDIPVSVEKNRQKLAAELSVSNLQFMSQTHSSNIKHFSGKQRLKSEEVQQTDALVFSGAGAAAAVMVADCVPVLIYDDAAGLYAVAHAGRAGVLGSIVSKTLTDLYTQGARDLTVILGPAICSLCYEIPTHMAQDCENVIPGSTGITREGTPSFDLKSGIRLEVAENFKAKDAYVEIQEIDICTFEDSRYFSYRKNQKAGRFVGGVVVHENSTP
ncbi:MAG: laccase domain-containing protein [Micrococcaceae bacterium]